MSHRLILSYDEINTMCLNTTLHLIMSFLNGEFTFSPSKHHKVLYFYLDFPTFFLINKTKNKCSVMEL